MDSKLYVVLRVLFKPDGSLAHEPGVIEGSASSLGSALAESAKRALIQCQPFMMLTLEHYDLWKDIEIKFNNELFTVPTQSAQPAPIGPTTPMVPGSALSSVSMRMEGGIYVVPVLINDAITLNFVVDSGAVDVSIPADVVMTLMRTGTLKEADFLGEKTYVLADGSEVPSQTFRIRSLKVGSKVLENVTGSVASVKGGLLLGQSFLSRFKSWSIDNAKHALLLSE